MTERDRLEAAFARHGVPDQILTDNAKVFTARFGAGPGPTLFDRICAQKVVRHILTVPRSPSTTGKTEPFGVLDLAGTYRRPSTTSCPT